VLWWTAALWGLAGAAAVEGLALYRAIQRVKDFPWRTEGEVPLPAYLASVAIRAGLGAGLAAAFGASQQVAGPLGALAVGIAAPKIVEQLLRQGLSHQAVEPKTPITAANMAETTTDATMRGDSDAA